MQHIVNEIRAKLSPFTGDSVAQTVVSENVPQTPEVFGERASRFIQRIPQQNYELLPRLAPISWI